MDSTCTDFSGFSKNYIRVISGAGASYAVCYLSIDWHKHAVACFARASDFEISLRFLSE